MSIRLNLKELKVISAIIVIGFLFTLLSYYLANNIFSSIIYIIAYGILTAFYVHKEKENIINIKTIFVVLYSIMIGISPVIYCFANLNSNALYSLFYQYPIFFIGYACLILGFYISFARKNKKTEKEKKQENYKIMRVYALILLTVSIIANIVYFITNGQILFNRRSGKC